MYLEVLYPQVQNFGIFWASGSVVYGTLFRNLNSFRSVATQRSRCRNRPFLPNENENPKSCFSSCEPSKRYESDWICSPNFVGVELSKRNTWKLNHHQVTTQNTKDPEKSWKLQCFPMSSSPCAQSRINSNSWWLFKSPRGFWLRRWISSNNCIANKKSPRVSSRNGGKTSKKMVDRFGGWCEADFPHG